MKLSGTYAVCEGSLGMIQQSLVDAIVQLVAPQMIYLLGTKKCCSKTESIFCSSAGTLQRVSGCFLLIVLKDTSRTEQYQWQDQIERVCRNIIPTTTIVISKNEFEHWLNEKQFFAFHVRQSAVSIYDAEEEKRPIADVLSLVAEKELLRKMIDVGLSRARAFLLGSELFRVQRYNSMAAFMLHQSTEHALHAILKAGTGYHTTTHNIDRLLNYASFVFPEVARIFPRETENEKRMFTLLQKAYSDARYDDQYKINSRDLLVITEKVRLLHGVLEDKHIGSVVENQ